MLVNQNVISSHGRTSIRLEPEFWSALDQICVAKEKTRHEIVREVEQSGFAGSLTGAVRVYILGWFMEAAA